MLGLRTTIFILTITGVLFGVLLFVFLGTKPQEQPATNLGSTESTLTIAGVAIDVAIADTEEERIQGLSGVLSLGPTEGLLFIFDEPGIYPFWMKDMRFPIDIIWLSSSFHVVDIAHNAQPDSYPRVFTPVREARYVLEVPAGFSTMHGVVVGLQAVFEK